MLYVALMTGYYLQPGVAALSDAAEVLYLRGRAYSGHAETHGYIPRTVLPGLTRHGPTRVLRHAQELVANHLWIPVHNPACHDRDGWHDTRWDEEQGRVQAAIEKRRDDTRRRVAEHRARQNASSQAHATGQTTHATGGHPQDVTRYVTHRLEEKRREDLLLAAADARGDPGLAGSPLPVVPAGNTTTLPPAAAILRAALDRHPETQVRWDSLTPGQLDELATLAALHGDQKLVESARRSAAGHDRPAVYVQAWFTAWRNLPPPGTPLAAIRTTTTRGTPTCAHQHPIAADGTSCPDCPQPPDPTRAGQYHPSPTEGTT